MSIKINSTINFLLREFWDFTKQKNLKVTAYKEIYYKTNLID